MCQAQNLLYIPEMKMNYQDHMLLQFSRNHSTSLDATSKIPKENQVSATIVDTKVTQEANVLQGIQGVKHVTKMATGQEFVILKENGFADHPTKAAAKQVLTISIKTMPATIIILGMQTSTTCTMIIKI